MNSYKSEKRTLSPIWMGPALFCVLVISQCAKPFPADDFSNLASIFLLSLNPSVAATAPSDGATDVLLTQQPTVLFDRAMDTPTITAVAADGPCSGNLRISADNFVNCLGGAVSFTTDQKGFVLVPVSPLAPQTTYKIKVTTAVQDTDGNSLPAEYTHAGGFTTTSRPTVASVSPANSSVNVSIKSTVDFSFSKSMTTATLISINAIGACAGGTVQLSPFPAYTICLPGTVSTSDNISYTFTPTSPLPEGVPLYFRVTSSVLDANLTGAAANFDSTFTPYTPMNTGGGTLQVWLKAGAGTFTDAGVTAATNGDQVQQWNDQSGNSNHGIQATMVRKPRLVTGILNGYSVMRFDGNAAPNNDHIDLTTVLADPEAISFTAIFVLKGSGMGPQHILSQQNGGGTGRVLLEHKPADRHGSNMAGAGFGGTAGYTDNTWIIYSVVWNRVNAASGTISLFQNGVADGTSASLDPDMATGMWRIAVSKNGTGNPFNGDIAEILLYNSALSATDRQTVESYLRCKYAISTCP